MVEAGVQPQIEQGYANYGVVWYPTAMDPKPRTRSYAVSGYYSPVANRRNLQLLTGTRVNTILFNSKKQATGVSLEKRQEPGDKPVKPITVSASVEVILCAGWLHTPQILQRSGIGPSSLLKAAGIKTLVDLPGVGSNFQDHAGTFAIWSCDFFQFLSLETLSLFLLRLDRCDTEPQLSGHGPCIRCLCAGALGC